MKKLVRVLLAGAILLGLSVLFFGVQYEIFHNRKDMVFYLLQDLGFLPLQVLLVTLVLDKMFQQRQKADRLRKMNMVIGAFFFEIGTPLLGHLLRFDRNPDNLRQALKLKADWAPSCFLEAVRQLQQHGFDMNGADEELPSLKVFLASHREMVLRLLENPNLLEHESFAELLLALSHLTDELAARSELPREPGTDADHLGNDLKRAFRLLVFEWVAYIRHLREDYPYILSLVIRTNPFDPQARAVLK